MGRTYIDNTKGTNGFWIEEDFITLLSAYICEEFESKPISEYTKPLQQVYDDCDANRNGETTGMVGLPLDRRNITGQDATDLIDIFQRTKATLLAKGELIEVSELNDIEGQKIDDSLKSPWSTSVYVSSLVTVLDALIEIVNGTFSKPDNFGFWFKGFGAPEGIEEV